MTGRTGVNRTGVNMTGVNMTCLTGRIAIARTLDAGRLVSNE